MEDSLTAAKAALRARVRAQLSQLTSAERAAASRALCERLREQAIWQSARSVMLFAPMPRETDVWPLVEEALASGKTVALPRFSSRSGDYAAAVVRDPASDLRPGLLGIREPTERCEAIALNRLDLVLVPGVAFDARGRRLGRGKGYYDRLLSDVRGVRCGVAFDEQIVPEVPVGPRDALLNCVVTPSRWLEC